MTGWGILWHHFRMAPDLWRENGQRHSAGRSVDVRLGKEKCTKVFHLSPRDRLGPKTEIFSTQLSKKNGDISKMWMNVKGTNNNWDSTNVKLRFKLQTSGKGIPNSFNGYFFSVSMATFGQYAYRCVQYESRYPKFTPNNGLSWWSEKHRKTWSFNWPVAATKNDQHLWSAVPNMLTKIVRVLSKCQTPKPGG